MIYHTVGTFRDRHPDWTFVRHEDLSREPVPGFESLFATLGVEIDDGIRRDDRRRTAARATRRSCASGTTCGSTAPRASSRGGGGSSPTEIERIRTGVADVAPAFYSEEDW